MRADITGKRFGRLIVLQKTQERTSNQEFLWLCRCDCGNDSIHAGSGLRNGHITSCGCKNIERFTKHGLSKTPEYAAYYIARNRCTNHKHESWLDYGGRGIQFNFNSFEEFLNHVGLRPTSKHSLDRIDNNGHYELGNVQWSTKKEQANNRRSKRIEQFTNKELLDEIKKRGLNVSGS